MTAGYRRNVPRVLGNGTSVLLRNILLSLGNVPQHQQNVPSNIPSMLPGCTRDIGDIFLKGMSHVPSPVQTAARATTVPRLGH
jgi:hypothetical protein